MSGKQFRKKLEKDLAKRTIISLIGSMILLFLQSSTKEQRKGITIFERAQKSMKGNNRPLDLCGIKKGEQHSTFLRSVQAAFCIIQSNYMNFRNTLLRAEHPPRGFAFISRGLRIGRDFCVWENQYIKTTV